MATINIQPYRRVNLPLVKQWIDSKGFDQLEQTIAELAIATGCPVIAICTFIGEIYGMTEQLQASLNRKMAFYQYSEVMG